MTTLKSKSSEKKRQSVAHSLSESDTDCPVDTGLSALKSNNQPLLHSTGNHTPNRKNKKSEGIRTDLDDCIVIPGEDNLLRSESAQNAAVLTGKKQTSRKRKRTEDVACILDKSCEIVDETVLPTATTPTAKPPKPKKRKLQNVPPSTIPDESAQEPEAGPSQATAQSVFPETSQVSGETSTAGAIDAGHTLFINPAEASLLYEDVTDDEEIWMIQCPKFVNPELLVGTSLNLVKKSKLKCKKLDGSNVKLDSYPVNHEAGSSKINLILPSEDETLKIKVADLQGKLILTERVTVPKIDYSAVMNTPKEEVAFPSNLKVRHPFLGLDIPKGRTVSLKHRRMEAEQAKGDRRTNLSAATAGNSVMSRSMSADCQEVSHVSGPRSNQDPPGPYRTVPSAARDYPLSLGNSSDTMNSFVSHVEKKSVKSKKKKRQHEERFLDDSEVKTEMPENENETENTLTPAHENFTSPSRNHLHISGNLPVDQPRDSPLMTVDENCLTKSKKRKKKDKELAMNETATSEAGNLTVDPKDEPNYPLEINEHSIEDSSVRSKKKKKKHHEKVHNDSEILDSEVKQEPVDPLDLGHSNPMDHSMTSSGKKKKKAHRESKNLDMLHTDFKIEPVDPLELGSDVPVDDSESPSRKKRRKHEGIRLSDSTILPVVCKSEWDSQESSFEQDDVSSSNPKKKKKKHKKLEDDNNPIIIEGIQQHSPPVDFNPSHNVEPSEKRKKKKRHSLETVDFSEIPCNDSEYAGVPPNLEIASGKHKKKKRKGGADNIFDEFVDTNSIKVEAINPIENEVESRFSALGRMESNFLPSFLDTLSNNSDLSLSGSSTAKSKRKSISTV